MGAEKEWPVTAEDILKARMNSAYGAAIVTRLERIDISKRFAIGESNRDQLLRLEGEETALRQLLDEVATRFYGVERVML